MCNHHKKSFGEAFSFQYSIHVIDCPVQCAVETKKLGNSNKAKNIAEARYYIV